MTTQQTRAQKKARPLIVDVISIFPKMFDALTQNGITERAFNENRWNLNCINPRDFVEKNYRSVDDRPYGGGAGMVMQAPPLLKAIEKANARQMNLGLAKSIVICLSPQGTKFSHQKAMQLVEKVEENVGFILLCGRYEGIDERVMYFVEEEISIGDFVVSGGEIPAMAMLDAMIRQLPGVLNDENSAQEDSFAMGANSGLLDYPHYTRPEVFEDLKVPEELLSGNHEVIRRWRLKEALGRTWLRRPTLLEKREMTQEEGQLLKAFQVQWHAQKQEQCNQLTKKEF